MGEHGHYFVLTDGAGRSFHISPDEYVVLGAAGLFHQEGPCRLLQLRGDCWVLVLEQEPGRDYTRLSEDGRLQQYKVGLVKPLTPAQAADWLRRCGYPLSDELFRAWLGPPLYDHLVGDRPTVSDAGSPPEAGRADEAAEPPGERGEGEPLPDAGPDRPPCPVQIQGEGKSILLKGRPIGSLRGASYRALEVIVKAHPRRLSGPELKEALPSVIDPGKHLRDIRGTLPALAQEIHFPIAKGPRQTGDGYGFKNQGPAPCPP